MAPVYLDSRPASQCTRRSPFCWAPLRPRRSSRNNFGVGDVTDDSRNPRFTKLFLPSMRKKPALADGSNPDGDLLQEHWLVDDMFIFENVGFTKDVGNIKFLVCADCEIGPIGWHCLDDKNSFYVALERVSHE
uniref:Guanine nucleotide exchange factor MSS4 n=1 Tax=Callorhinus ursinus TaxID=34884 RepID=A0A3Q7MUN7_CALUR|nr:guanine nucleotide exchange factor MSS4 isoform X1 [Callorhinus ursinus]